MNRRKFLKYAGTSAAAVGASALGLDYILTSRPGPMNQNTTILNHTTSSSKTNHPPVASFKRNPWYLNPTDQQAIEFTNLSTDPDGDPLTYRWLKDNQLVSEEKDCSTKLPVGQHLIELETSDAQAKTVTTQAVTVEPDQMYPKTGLHLRYKGVCYCAGRVAPEWSSNPNPSGDEMDEQLDSIRGELGCNAIVIFAGGDHEDQLIECGQLAIEKGFDRIYIGPEYMGASPEETVERLASFASKVRELREKSERVVFLVGHEFGLETAIVRGKDWFERLATMNKGMDWDKVTHTLPTMFGKIIQACNKNYGYKISYRAICTEADLVPWSNPVFESVGVDAYIQDSSGWTEDWILALLSRLKNYRKPVLSTEAGCETFTGAGRIGGNILWGVWDEPYDEDEQANYIKRYCNLLNRAKIDGYFYTVYNDDFDKGYGLYNGKKRKKGFYMYKSYQRVT